MPVLRTNPQQHDGSLWFEAPSDPIARSNDEIREGTILWRYDTNRRAHTRREHGSRSIERAHYAPVRVVGETPKSWLVVDVREDETFRGVSERSERPAPVVNYRQRKVSKADLRESDRGFSYRYHLSIEDEVFRHETSVRLRNANWDAVDINALRQIASLMGWPLVPDREDG